MTTYPNAVNAVKIAARRSLCRANHNASRVRQFSLAALSVALLAAFAPAAWAADADTAAAVPEIRFTISRFELTGTNPLGGPRAQEVLRPYLGEQHGLDGLQNAAKALEQALHAEGYGLYRVVLPPQETVDVIKLEIVGLVVNKVTVVGNKFHNEANVRASLPALHDGETPDMYVVARQLTLANENSSKHTDVHMRESEDGNGIVAEIETRDSTPLSGAIGLNNSGTPDTAGRARVMAYVQYANVFNLDHVASLSYVTSPKFPDSVKQYGLSYRIPIYALGDDLAASYSNSSVNSGALGSGQNITGRGTVVGLVYTHRFRAHEDYSSNVTLSYDDKLFKAPIVAGTALPNGDVRSRPVTLAYHGTTAGSVSNFSFHLEYASNFRSGPANSDAAYAANRAGASRNWEVWRASYQLTSQFPSNWAFVASVHYQFTTNPLISGEQFGLGGSGSVRGVSDRAVTGDRGLASSIELWTPELAKSFRMIYFLDSGSVRRNFPAAGVLPTDSLQSLGVGVRWGIAPNLQLALDWGTVVRGTVASTVPTGTSLMQGNLLYSF